MAGSMVYRLRVAEPTTAHMATFVKAIRAMQARLDNKGFNYVSGLHGAPSWYCWHHQTSPLTSLQARLFLPWHRAYLQRLEQLAQDAFSQHYLTMRDRKGRTIYIVRRNRRVNQPVSN